MKTILIPVLILILSLKGFGQNNGRSPENNILRIEYLGFSNNIHTYKVVNKLNCLTTVKVWRNGDLTDHTLNALQEQLLTINAPFTPQSTLKVKKESGGECVPMPDNGWIELQSPIALPIKFGSITAKRVSPTTIELVFESEEDLDIKYYNIKVSSDGKNFKTVVVVFPNKVQGKKRYVALVKVNS